MIDSHHGWNFSFKPQFLGFVVSLILMVSLYRIVSHYELTDFLLTVTIFGASILMALFQLVFFMHLGFAAKPHWPLITFAFTVLVIFVVVGGTLWIMNNLEYNLMPPMQH